MRHHYTVLFSMGMVATTFCGRAWSSEFSPTAVSSQKSVSEQSAAKVVTVSRMSMSNFHDSIADRTSIVNAPARQDECFPFRTGWIGRSHQHVKQICQENRNCVTGWFCYIKGNGPAIWYMGP